MSSILHRHGDKRCDSGFFYDPTTNKIKHLRPGTVESNRMYPEKCYKRECETCGQLFPVPGARVGFGWKNPDPAEDGYNSYLFQDQDKKKDESKGIEFVVCPFKGYYVPKGEEHLSIYGMEYEEPHKRKEGTPEDWVWNTYTGKWEPPDLRVYPEPRWVFDMDKMQFVPPDTGVVSDVLVNVPVDYVKPQEEKKRRFSDTESDSEVESTSQMVALRRSFRNMRY